MDLNSVSENGLFAPRLLAQSLRTTIDEIADSSGLSHDALARSKRVGNPKTQKRLREMVEILARVSPRFESDLMAYAWYRSAVLPGYGVTSMHLLRDGRAAEIHAYLDRLDAGIYA